MESVLCPQRAVLWCSETAGSAGAARSPSWKSSVWVRSSESLRDWAHPGPHRHGVRRDAGSPGLHCTPGADLGPHAPGQGHTASFCQGCGRRRASSTVRASLVITDALVSLWPREPPQGSENPLATFTASPSDRGGHARSAYRSPRSRLLEPSAPTPRPRRRRLWSVRLR